MREARVEKDDSNMTNAETNDKAATAAEQAAHVAPAKPASRKGASKTKGAPKAKKSAKAAIPKKAAKPKGATEARTNKKAEVIANDEAREGRNAVAAGFLRVDLETVFASCKLAGHFTIPYGIENNAIGDQTDIFVCRRPREPWDVFWRRFHSFG
jgi:hypothetical protein